MTELDDIQSTWRTGVDNIIQGYQTQIDSLTQRNTELEKDNTELGRVVSKSMPTEQYVGVPDGVELEPITGTTTFSTSQYHYRKDFQGTTWFKAPGLEFEECKFSGPVEPNPKVSQAIINAIDPAAQGWYAKNCTVSIQSPHWLVDCVHSWYGTMENCLLERGTDLFAQIPPKASDIVYNEVFGCILKNPVFWTGLKGIVHPSSPFTHNDCLALLGGTGGYFHHNRMDAIFSQDGGTQDYPDNRANACVQFNNGKGLILGARVENNWMNGGQYAVNLGAILSGQRVGTLVNNIIFPTQRLKGQAIYGSYGVGPYIRGNSWSTGQSIL